MEFMNTQSYRCLKSICLWSLIFNLTIVLCFFIGYILTCIVGFTVGADFAQGFGWLAIVVPTILTAMLSVVCFMISIGYFAFVIYLECKGQEYALPLIMVNNTEQIFNKLIKNNIIKNIVIFISVISFVFSLLISVMNILAIFIGFMTFGILLLVHNRDHVQK